MSILTETELEEPPSELQIPWSPRIVIRGSSMPKPEPKTEESTRLLKLAFQSGLVQGQQRIEARYPNTKLDSRGHLNRDLPSCAEADDLCRRQVELARDTGAWALAT